MTIQRTKERIKQTGEVFTPLPLVDEILDKLPPEVFTNPTKKFLDPACGDGNFLVRVIAHKIAKGSMPEQALKTTYGVDIMRDNIQTCKVRVLLYAFFHDQGNKGIIEFLKTATLDEEIALDGIKEQDMNSSETFSIDLVIRKSKNKKFKKFIKDNYQTVDDNIVWYDALTYHYKFDGTFPDPTYNDQPS